MKRVINEVLRFLIGFGLRSYYKKIKISGLENIPKGKPILILPNHQNGLIDPILIGTLCKLNPYYLARSDVFKNPIANWFLRTIQMMPIYRIRDGRDLLHKNEEIFDQCSDLLLQSKNLMLFPEGSHGIDRRVRMLKNGFYHILSRALKQNPDIDIQILPIGFNYKHLEQFPDSVAIKIGTPISVQQLIKEKDESEHLILLKKELKKELIKLTTHIDDQENYTEVFEYLHYKRVDFLEPEVNNQMIASYQISKTSYPIEAKKVSFMSKFVRILLYILNFPIVLFWRLSNPKRFDIEFVSTFRFAYAAFGYVLYMTVIACIAWCIVPIKIVFVGIVLHYLLSRLLVKAI